MCRRQSMSTWGPESTREGIRATYPRYNIVDQTCRSELKSESYPFVLAYATGLSYARYKEPAVVHLWPVQHIILSVVLVLAKEGCSGFNFRLLVQLFVGQVKDPDMSNI
jgi:hypothetical protein